MTAMKLRYARRKKGLEIATETGFALTGGVCEIRDPAGKPLGSTGRPRHLQPDYDFMIKRLANGALEMRQTWRNTGTKTLPAGDIRMFEGRLELKGAGWRAAHCELFKHERYFEDYSTATGHFFAPLPGLEGDFGISEDWPFPGFFCTHPERGTVLMAVLSQERCKPVWSLRRRGKSTLFRATEHFAGIPGLPIAKGAKLTSERWVILCVPGGVEDAIDSYYRLLRKTVKFRGADSILRRALVWGTWNYNPDPKGHAGITHATVLKNARALKALAPRKPRVAMIDDGYQFGLSRKTDMRGWLSTCFEHFHDDGNPTHDPILFPKGMQGIAADIRKAGAIPALWVTPRIPRQSNLARERPEWLLRTQGNRGFGARSAYLDYSLPAVRDFTRNVWHTIFDTWGYRGLKLDFWSLPFEIPQVRYRNRNRTAIELRNLFLEDLRACMPADAFLLLAVACNTGGNPFVGRYADAARMGADIGQGGFNLVSQAAYILAMATPFYRHDCLLGDPESIGWCPQNTPGQNRVWATTALLTGGMCEIGGNLFDLSAEAAALLRTVVRLHRPRRQTRNNISYPGFGGMPADRLVLTCDDDVYVGELNWTPLPREIRLSKPARDLWTGTGLKDRHKIPPNDAVLYRV